MSVLIAQLGDIHIQTADDPVLSRADVIAAAIATDLSKDVTTIVLAMCGDTAYSGDPQQFDLAAQFMATIQTALSSRCEHVDVLTVAVPGNHDCDFTGDQEARNVMLASLSGTERPAQSVLDIVLKPLEAYFAFADSRVDEQNSISQAHPFYHSVDIQDGEYVLRFHLINTAWMSTLHESKGSLKFPLEELGQPEQRAHLDVAILHHPTEWFSQPHTMRPLRDRIAALSPILLVNHEHVSEATQLSNLFTRDDSGARIDVRGGVLQEPNGDLCTFNTLRLEPATKHLTIHQYTYNENRGRPFFERTETADTDIVRDHLVRGPAGASLTQDWANYLNDPGAPITHPNRDPRIPILLDDIFMYPDLWELDEEHDGSSQKQVRSSDVSRKVLETTRCLITGSEKSGRTSLSKRLYLDALDAGKLPLLLNGDDAPKTLDRFQKFVRKSIGDQYGNIAVDEYMQRDRSERIVIVDDIQRLTHSQDQRQAILGELERQFCSVILIGDDLIRLDDMNGRDSRDSSIWEYRHFVILGLGEHLREEFVRQWLLLGQDSFLGGSELQNEVNRICALLNAVVRKNLLPTYPLYLLVLLQQTDIAHASVQGGSFGKLFEHLVTAILNRSDFKKLSIADKYCYLAAMSKMMYDRHSMSVPRQDALQWHKEYWESIEVDVDFDRISEDLATLGFLQVTTTTVTFRYPYFFCFFVGYFLHRNIHEDATREIVKQLCGQLHHRVSAEIVLFLTHLTGDPILLDEMMGTCSRLFADAVPATLGDDIVPLNQLGQVFETIEIPDAPDQNRKEMKLRSDSLVAERLAATKSDHDLVAPVPDNEAVKRLFDIHAAHKTIQILGQALRNVAGSATKDRKEAVLEMIFGLSRRLLGSYFECLDKDSLPQVLQDMAAAHKEQQPEVTATELHDAVGKHLYGMSQFVCFIVIKHTTSSVGSDNLAPTIHRMLRGGDDMVHSIMDLSFDLDQPNRFPKDRALSVYGKCSKNRFAGSLARILVAHHIYMYDVPRSDRQAVCDKMDIKLLPSVLDSRRKKLTRSKKHAS